MVPIKPIIKRMLPFGMFGISNPLNRSIKLGLVISAVDINDKLIASTKAISDFSRTL